MFIWDGTDRQENDLEAAFADMIRRAMISDHPNLTAAIRSYVAAIAMELTGSRSGDLAAPEPLIQGGFTPSDEERAVMCESVMETGRDLVHICFRTVEPYTPTGLIVVVFRDGDRVRLHSRCSTVWVAKDRCVRLYGFEDETDQSCQFVFQRGKKLRWVDGHDAAFDSPELLEAASRIEQRIETGAIGNAGNEPLKFYHQNQTHGGTVLL